jgi:uncharacterized membrane protein
VVDHYLLGIHHVRPGPDAALYDAAFLAWGAVFVGIGWWLLRSAAGRKKVAPNARYVDEPDASDASNARARR